MKLNFNTVVFFNTDFFLVLLDLFLRKSNIWLYVFRFQILPVESSARCEVAVSSSWWSWQGDCRSNIPFAVSQ